MEQIQERMAIVPNDAFWANKKFLCVFWRELSDGSIEVKQAHPDRFTRKFIEQYQSPLTSPIIDKSKK